MKIIFDNTSDIVQWLIVTALVDCTKLKSEDFIVENGVYDVEMYINGIEIEADTFMCFLMSEVDKIIERNIEKEVDERLKEELIDFQEELKHIRDIANRLIEE